MLHAIDHEMLHWQCLILDRKGRVKSCGQWKTAHIDEAEYQLLHDEDGTGRGAVIALPRCECGAHCFLKADYDLEELYDELQEVTDEETGATVAVLPYRYIRNLQAHWMLYERGKADYAPVLPMPPIALLERPEFASVKPATVMALWFGYLAARPDGTALKELEEASSERL
jgi:hypothetical protein